MFCFRARFTLSQRTVLETLDFSEETLLQKLFDFASRGLLFDCELGNLLKVCYLICKLWAMSFLVPLLVLMKKGIILVKVSLIDLIF